MIVKENQPAVYAAIETFFRGALLAQEDDRDTFIRSGKGHGRVETRTLTCSGGLGAYVGWPGAKQVAMRRCRRTDTRSGRVSCETTYAVTSLDRKRAAA